MAIHHVRRGQGKPLILIHGLGSTRRSWSLIGLALAQQREVISLDLPGHGESPAEADSTTFAGIARSFDGWLTAEGLAGSDMVGSSMGGRIVLEMARRGRTGAVVALDPGGFWEAWERQYVYGSLIASATLLRSLGPALPLIAHSAAARTAILAQLSHRPWALPGDLVESELASIAATRIFDALLRDLAFGELQEGPAASGSGPVTIGWGRHDRLLLPVQAERACAAFPGARLHWFDHSGHFPMLDEPDAAIALIRSAVG
jgi:pimeloyl-ACP methyl ester carboxylesterase